MKKLSSSHSSASIWKLTDTKWVIIALVISYVLLAFVIFLLIMSEPALMRLIQQGRNLFSYH